jgi:hypothetical protein
MKHIPQSCDLQFYVCVNERSDKNPLPSCGSTRGNEIFELLKKQIIPWASRLGLRVWVNRSLCQGFCAAQGVTVSVFPMQLRVQALTSEDIPQLLKDVEKQSTRRP